MFSIAIIVLYGLALVMILFYSIFQLILAVSYRKAHAGKTTKGFRPIEKVEQLPVDELPVVTIQLPIYNEYYVVERLLRNFAKMEYPLSKLEIQVLDDSTDETVELVAKLVEEIREHGVDIKHIRRKERVGYKAGALDYGLKIAKGEFIAIFDADFLPNSDFLLNTVPFFKDENIGVVQTRWAHINKDHSLLTKLQAFALDAHFSIEQTGRNALGKFINFNGTAGIWRKKTIYDAGGWEHDTITEDLDLSYRAQLKGWKFRYVECIESPAELPVAISAVRQQQFRWNKGGAENFRKMFSRIVTDKRHPLSVKLHGVIHLMNSSVFLFAFLVSLLSVPALCIKIFNDTYDLVFMIGGVFILSTIFLMFYYWTSYKDRTNNYLTDIPRFLGKFFMFLSMSMALSLHNTIAVIEGLAGKKSSFVRTPKFNVMSGSNSWKSNKYLSKPVSLLSIFEGILSVYYLFGVVIGIVYGDYGLLPFHLMLFIGFSILFYYNFNQVRARA